jgi:hypothetical protein
MRKAPIEDFGISNGLSASGSWLDLEELATAELSSEDPRHPFEEALKTDDATGWRALGPGPQLIRLRFDTPQAVKRVRLQFREEQVNRSQEIALFATGEGYKRKELIRQQWGFSPHGSTTELEDFFFELKGVTAIELEIDPGRHDKSVFASLASIRIG